MFIENYPFSTVLLCQPFQKLGYCVWDGSTFEPFFKVGEFVYALYSYNKAFWWFLISGNIIPSRLNPRLPGLSLIFPYKF